MADTTKPDLLIIGAGRLGLALAHYARQLGASVTLVDRGAPECGDQPQASIRLAALSVTANLAEAQRQGHRFGLPVAETKISMKAVQARAQRIATERAVADSDEQLASRGVNVVRGAVSFSDTRTVQVGDVSLRPRRIVIATGGMPLVPKIAGLDQIDYFTVDSLAENTRKLTHLVIIGGNAEAVAQAQIQRRLGAAVTLVPQGALLPGYDPETSALLLRALASEGIRVMAGATVRSIVPRAMGTGVVTDTAEGVQETLDASHILVAMGRSADLSDLRIESANLRPAGNKTGSFVTGALGKTANPRIRLVGHAAGYDQWNEMLAHGRSVIEALVVGRPKRRNPICARIVQTTPALAQLGPLVDARNGGPGQYLLRVNFAENDQARALGAEAGLLKARVASSGKVLGASIFGEGAGELAAVLALFMERGLSIDGLADLALPNPSLTAILVQLGERFRAQQPVGWMEEFRRRFHQALPIWK